MLYQSRFLNPYSVVSILYFLHNNIIFINRVILSALAQNAVRVKQLYINLFIK
jgi:hypothetical protein